MTQQLEHDARRQTARLGDAAPAFFRMSDVVRITALSRATLYRRIAEGRFPPPVHLGGRACGWSPQALQAWIDDPAGYCIQLPRAASQHSGTTRNFGHESDTAAAEGLRQEKST